MEELCPVVQARKAKAICFYSSYFLGPLRSKSRKEGGVLRQQEGAQMWDPAFPAHSGICGLLISEVLG